MARVMRLLLTGLNIAFITGCNTRTTIDTATLHNTSNFPSYESSTDLIGTGRGELMRSNKRTGD